MKLFLDTSFFIAALYPRDQHAEEAQGLLRRIADGDWQGVYTTDTVLIETLNYLRAKTDSRVPSEALIGLVFGTPRRPPLVRDILRIHSALFAASLDRFRTYFDHGLSLTDWTIVLAMEQNQVRDLATFDNGFRAFVNTIPTPTDT